MDEKKALKIYKANLKIVERKVGVNTTWQSDLDKLGRRMFGSKFVGVFPSDIIPKLSNGCYCILNVDKSNEPGSHWVALVKRGHRLIFYDSFGRSGKKLIPSLLKSHNGRLVDTDSDAEQKILESNCGARCIAWLMLYDEYGLGAACLI